MHPSQQWLERQNPEVVAAGSLLAVVALGIVDLLTGTEISLSIAYLLPTCAAAWRLGAHAGSGVAFASATAWLLADLAAGSTYSHPLIPYWNSLVRLGFFLFAVVLLSRIRDRARAEREILAEVQSRLLPTELPRLAGARVAAIWRPAQSVGGDYYDVLPQGRSRVALCIADVAGKGMPAALLMSNVQAAVRALAPGSRAPHRLCEKLNEVVGRNVTPARFVSFFYGQLDLESGDWTYCNAGHEPPVLVRRDGTTARLSTGGPVLGVLPRTVYRQESLRLSRGDRIVMFTDGVTEATDRTGEELGLHRLLQIVERNREESPEWIVKRLFEVTESFCRGPFLDDVTLLTVAYDGLRASNRIDLFLREHPARLPTSLDPPPTRRVS